MTVNGHGLHYAITILNQLQKGMVCSVSKRFVPTDVQKYRRPGISVEQVVTWSEQFPNQMVTDIMTNYADGKILPNGDHEYEVYDSWWTVHLKENNK